MSYIKKIKVGNLELDNNIFLAPMAGITDLGYRIITKKYGDPGLVCTEMVSSKAIHYNDEKTKKMLIMDNEKRPIAIQIFGSDPKVMGESAKRLSNIADIIDINMGCPAPKVVKNGDGSKLLLDLSLVKEIVTEVVRNTEKPVSVKIRKGWDSTTIVAVETAKVIEKAGAKLITIHGRTRAEYYSGMVDLDIIKQVKEAVTIPVIGNGDIKTEFDAANMFLKTGCDGIMIGRGALGKPWFLKDVKDFLQDGKQNKPIKKEKILEIILEHINLEAKLKGELSAVREMRKHISWYLKGLENSSNIRNLINKLETRKEVEEELVKYFESI